MPLRMTSAIPPASPATETVFVRILTSALFAGAVGGLVAALLQLYFVQPVMLHAELYESGVLEHFGVRSDTSAHQDLRGFDVARDGLSIVFTILTYTGYALVLVAAMSLAEQRGAAISPRMGLIWGLAGFVAVQFAPGFSLAPEVPGVAAAALFDRQMWWLATVVSAGAGLWLVAFGRSRMAWGAAVVLLLAPHAIGAPEPEVFIGSAPPEIAALFTARAYGVGMAAWAVIGCLAGYFWSRTADGDTAV